MTQARARLLIRVIAATAILVLAWWLFGIRVHQMGHRTLVLRRVFGRVTRVQIFEGFAERERILFLWSEPYGGDPATDCGAIWPEHWLDMNGDGRWDTWLKRVGPDATGHCLVEYQVDTTNSGRPDWFFVLPLSEYQKGAAMMKRRRGF